MKAELSKKYVLTWKGQDRPVNDEEARWLVRRQQERIIQQNEIAKSIQRAVDSGKRFRVNVEYLEPDEHRMMQQEGDRTFTVPSGPPKETE